MTGIAALVRQDEPVSQHDFDAVFDALEHRSWDGADRVVLDRAALGHQHAYTTPEEVGERQPIEHDGVWLTFDGRIDNRTEVLEHLRDHHAELSENPSDAEITLSAYCTIGLEFLDLFVGAFALIIWDSPEERLLLARDKTDLSRSLYYAESGDVIVAASEMQAVLTHPAVLPTMNEGLLGEFLADEVKTPIETFYENIFSVEPGSFVEWSPDGVRTERYWNVWDAAVELDPSKDPAEEFLSRFEQAVECRLRSPTCPGVMLSGGLDSTSIACVARRILDRNDKNELEETDGDHDLHAFSLLREDEAFEDEIERIRAVVETCDLRSHVVHAEDHYTLKDTELYEELASESPRINSLIQGTRSLYDEATDTGRTALLTGVGGNMYDGNRFYYLDLLRSLRLGTFFHHARSDFYPIREILKWFVLVPSSPRIASFVRRQYGDAIETGVPEWIDDEFADRTRLEERLTAGTGAGFDSVSKELMFNAYFRSSRRFEAASDRRVALEAGVDLRNPLLDSRLLSFLFALPSWETFDAGQDKVLVRRAMEGILPEIVRMQSDAVVFDPIIDLGIKHRRRSFVEELLTDPHVSRFGIVDECGFEGHVREYLDGPRRGSRRVWALLSTELWLRQWPFERAGFDDAGERAEDTADAVKETDTVDPPG